LVIRSEGAAMYYFLEGDISLFHDPVSSTASTLPGRPERSLFYIIITNQKREVSWDLT